MNKLLTLVALALVTSPLLAADDGGLEAKLREALRNSMLQLRDAQGQIATLQSDAVVNDQKLKAAQAQIDVLTKQAIADRNTSTNMIAELNTRLEEEKTVITSCEASLNKWKASYGEVTALAQKKEAERAKLQDTNLKLSRQVQDQKIRNIGMYKVGVEILDRYEKFGLGDALLAREPFVGTTKVKFQTLIQNDQDKLTDNRIQP